MKLYSPEKDTFELHQVVRFSVYNRESHALSFNYDYTLSEELSRRTSFLTPFHQFIGDSIITNRIVSLWMDGPLRTEIWFDTVELEKNTYFVGDIDTITGCLQFNFSKKNPTIKCNTRGIYFNIDYKRLCVVPNVFFLNLDGVKIFKNSASEKEKTYLKNSQKVCTYEEQLYEYNLFKSFACFCTSYNINGKPFHVFLKEYSAKQNN